MSNIKLYFRGTSSRQIFPIGESKGEIDRMGQTKEINQIGEIDVTAVKRVFSTPKEINQFLKDNKGKLTIKEISDKLKISKTKVEHYFRTDSSRAIPNPLIWKKLKEILCFDNSFDKQVTETYEKEVEFESSRRIYGTDGLSPTIESTSNGKIIYAQKSDREIARIYDPNGLSPTLHLKTGGWQEPKIVADGVANAVTPDAYLTRGMRNRDENGKAVLTSMHERRIRRLTPVECERLQGFPDNYTLGSDTQRYKQCGNAVTVNVIEAIAKKIMEVE